MVIVPLLLAIGALIIVWDRIKSIRAGLPVDDERAKKLHWKAGAYTYYATIWLALGTIWYNILFAERLGFVCSGTGYDEVRKTLQSLYQSKDHFKVHMLFIALGRKFCRARGPSHQMLPVKRLCPSAKV